MKTIYELANDLERHLHGTVDSQFIREQYGNADNSDISALMSSIEHFLSDSDIRAKDINYRKMQEEEMTKLIKLLRSDRINDAKRTSFLQKSKAV
jgi:hypothetical protein